jgi:Alkaline and neutral invertase
MEKSDMDYIQKAKQAALTALRHNANGPFHGLPRTAGWGYPEPYTRDLMISLLGISATGDAQLLKSMHTVLITLAKNQTIHGHIPSLVHDKNDLGASDTTPLFLLAAGIYREISDDNDFLKDEVDRSLNWMAYQSPSDQNLIAQQPTSDWRDEQWVLGFGLFVNTLIYSALRQLGLHEKADNMRREMNLFNHEGGFIPHQEKDGNIVQSKPYYAFWFYKVYQSDSFDLLGNSIAILSGIASLEKANAIIDWVENECAAMRKSGKLAVDLPPNFFPFTYPGDPEWLPRYEFFNLPGNYHNGGIWPFICGFYIAALVAAERFTLAEKKLVALTLLISEAATPGLEFGFNEWHKAQNGKVMGQDWQTWSASMYLYAAQCVEEKRTPFFENMRREK